MLRTVRERVCVCGGVILRAVHAIKSTQGVRREQAGRMRARAMAE